MLACSLVIFDNDGVLVDSEPIAASVMSEVLTALGCPMSTQQCMARFKGSSLARTRRIAEQLCGRRLPDKMEALYERALFDRFERSLAPVEGVEAVLEHLDASGMPYCLASSGTHSRILRALELTGLLGYFGERRWSAQDVEHGKPAPDLFLLAAAKMGFDPEHSVVIEDSSVGVAAARAAGMSVLGYCALTPCEDLAGADATFDRMSQLPSLLGL